MAEVSLVSPNHGGAFRIDSRKSKPNIASAGRKRERDLADLRLHMGKESREGYEFTLEQKEEARTRAGGRCEFPPGCDRPNNRRVGHLSGIADGKFRAVPAESITHIDNTIVQCEGHDLNLDEQQQKEIVGVRNGTLYRSPFPVELDLWVNP